MKADYVKHTIPQLEIPQRLPCKNSSPFVGISTMREQYPPHALEARERSLTNRPPDNSQDDRRFQGCSVMKDDYTWKDLPRGKVDTTRRQPCVNAAKFEGESTSGSTYVFRPRDNQPREATAEKRWIHPGGEGLFNFKLDGCSTTQLEHNWKPPSKPSPLPQHKWSKNVGQFWGKSTTKTDYVEHPIPLIPVHKDRCIPVHKFEGESTTKSVYVRHPVSRKACLPRFKFSPNTGRFYGASVMKEDYKVPTR